MDRSTEPRLRSRIALALGAVVVVLVGMGPRAFAEEEAPSREEAKRAAAADAAAFAERVNKAIDRGATWLLGTQKKDGAFPGFSEDMGPRTYSIMEPGVNALVLYTLAHCGYTIEDKRLKRCLEFCRKHYSGSKDSIDLKGSGNLTIYVASTLIVALDKLYRGAPKVVPGRKPDRYGNPAPPKPLKCKYPASIKRWIAEMVDFIVESQHESGGWRYPGNPLGAEEGETDISNVQYALLALEVANECGIKVPKETWSKAAAYLIAAQEDEGLEVELRRLNPAWEPGDTKTPKFVAAGQTQARGWTYMPGQQAYATASMTCAGITCLALLKERLWVAGALDPKTRKGIDAALVDGLAWLADTFTVENNVDGTGTAQMWHYYYLYGLERTGAKTGVTYIGEHDWYREGAEHLLAAQEKDGGWKEADGQERPADSTELATTQTCFALLFLKRTTRKPAIPMTPPVLTGE